MREYRYNLRWACAWRVIAELFRQHRAALDLRVNHVHPGLSAGGELIITEGPLLLRDPPATRLRISLLCAGGADAGRLWCDAPSDVANDHGTNGLERKAESLNVIDGLLSAESPRSVVHQINAMAGLPNVDPLPPSDRPTFVSRVIAGFMERRILSPAGWRPNCGWYDTSAAGCAVSDWVRAFPDEWRSLNVELTHENRYDLARRAARFWLLTRAKKSHDPQRMVAAEDGPSMAFDMATGRASLVGIDKPPFDLWAHYLAKKWQVSDVVRWVEDRVGA